MTKTIIHETVTGKRCRCGQYHHTCCECRCDCTIGMPRSPATTALDGKRRCYFCNQKHTAKLQILYSAAPDADRIIRHLAEWFKDYHSISTDCPMPADGYYGATADQTLADAIRLYLKKVDGGK